MVMADMTNDGNLDIVVGGDESGYVFWYENPGDPSGTWSEYEIDYQSTGEIEGTEAGDIDGDEIVEVFSLNQNDGVLTIYKPSGGDPTDEASWESTILDDNAPYLQDAYICDLTGDGEENDLIYTHDGSQADEGALRWLEFTGSDPMDPSDWALHELVQQEGAHGLVRDQLDVSRNGRGDLVFSARTGWNSDADGGLWWVEKPSDPYDTPWTDHQIGPLGKRKGITNADLSGHGEPLDILCDNLIDQPGENAGDGMGFYRYPGPSDVTDPNAWLEVEVDSGSNWRNVAAHDWKGSPRDQLITLEGSEDQFYLWEYDEDTGTWVDSLQGSIGKADDNIWFVDLDGDGDAEMVTAGESNENEVAWWDVQYPEPSYVASLMTTPTTVSTSPLTLSSQDDWQDYESKDDQIEITDGGIVRRVFEETGGIVDDFETANLDSYSVGTSYWELETSEVVEGDQALTASSPEYRLISRPGDGLQNYPSPGDVYSVKTYTGSSRPTICYGVDANDNDHYGIFFKSADGVIRISRYDSGARTDIVDTAASVNINTWYDVEIAWGSDGSHEITVYELDADGNRADQIFAEAIQDSTYPTDGTDPGIGFYSENSDSSLVFDHARITEGMK
ncbi:hypothetical protein C445_00776 [Halobiforma lacisalsi AJ5]|nr:hypothetical protein C445_00776 [Halobiforma lacisalsi AJ5]